MMSCEKEEYDYESCIIGSWHVTYSTIEFTDTTDYAIMIRNNPHMENYFTTYISEFARHYGGMYSEGSTWTYDGTNLTAAYVSFEYDFNLSRFTNAQNYLYKCNYEIVGNKYIQTRNINDGSVNETFEIRKLNDKRMRLREESVMKFEGATRTYSIPYEVVVWFKKE